MSLNICISASMSTINRQGGVAWMYLNWALGLQEFDCEIIWLETEIRDANTPESEIRQYVSGLRSKLQSFGLKNFRIALCSQNGDPFPWDQSDIYLNLEDAASEADLLLNLAYHSHPGVVNRFRRTAFLDTDPGHMQYWLSEGLIDMTPHDIYFTIGETVGTSEARFPDCGLTWHFTPPPVYMAAWPRVQTDPSAAYTTASNWWGKNEWIEFDGEYRSNSKRDSFLKYLDLPAYISAPVELALTLGQNDVDIMERSMLEQHGWKIRSLSSEGGWSPQEYRIYVQQSRGEFSCAKPFYVIFRSSLVFDRTLHYMASGKPAIVQYTGPSSFLPDDEGMFRFRNKKDVIRAFSKAEADYENQCKLARKLVEEYFDSKKIIGKVLELAIA